MTPYYKHGGITIYHGDAFEVLSSLNPDDFAAMVSDVPYGIDYETSRGASWARTGIAGDKDLVARDRALAWWGERPALIFGSWKRPAPDGAHTALVWDKGPAFGMGNLTVPWKPSWETIFVLGHGFAGHRDEGVLRGHLIVSWESGGRVHPTEKPLSLMVALLSKCPAGAIVDPFCGSGPTLRAAKDLGRAAVGIEIGERNCELSAKRLSQETLFAPSEPVPTQTPFPFQRG